ncbi:hypothetical protein AB0M27_47305, partial [Streptomyces sp. NPDC052107]
RVSVFAHKFFPGAEYGVVEANGRPGLLLVQAPAPDGTRLPPVPFAFGSQPDSADWVRARLIISMTGHVTSLRQNHHM